MVIASVPKSAVLALQDRLAAMEAGDFLDNFVAFHAAPTVRGLKPATLACPHREAAELTRVFPGCAERLEENLGLKLTALSTRRERFMVMAYQPCLVETVLAAEDCRVLLRQAGFDHACSLDRLFEQLRQRCGDCAFPHEIGVLLGYPPADVRGFIRDGGKGAKLTGGWRVYSDVEAARRRFGEFRQARSRAAKLILSGASLAEVGRGLRNPEVN